MYNFNLKKSAIYSALKWEANLKLLKIFKKAFAVLSVFLFLLFLYGFLFDVFSRKLSRFLLSFLIISLVFFLSSWFKESFFESKLKKPKLKAGLSEVIADPGRYNLAEFLSFETAKAVNEAVKIARPFEITSAHLLYSVLDNNPKLNFVFSRILLGLEKIKKIVREKTKKFPDSKENVSILVENFKNTIFEALKVAQKRNHARIEIGDALIALTKHSSVFREILMDYNFRAEDIENLVWWMEDIENEINRRREFWKYENLAKRGTLAKEWAFGYTVTLDKYSVDLTDIVRKNLPKTIGHKEEIGMMERILSRRRINNVLIVGEPGTGRKSMIYALAEQSISGESLPEVNYKRVVELDMPSLLAGTENIEEVEVVLDKIFQEAVSAGNIILVVDEIHNYIGQKARPGVIDISGALAPYLKLSQFQIIGITTYGGLHEHIEKNSSVLSLFEKVEVSGITSRETFMLLEDLSLVLEKKYKKIISYPAIREIVDLTDRYMPSLPFPEKAVRILDEVVIYVADSTEDEVVLPKHVAEVVAKKTEIPVGEVETKEKKILLNLEKLIHQRIINQDEAVKEISAALRRARSEITVRKGPMGTFIFLGPTGVGKTETSKALAEVYFGSEKRMIRLDMSEFQSIKDISRLIGSAEETGLLTTPVRENPFSLILLDEFEKAHPNILNLFLQVFDEGHLTDGLGRKVDFKNTIIISTSNAGYKVILKALEEEANWAGVKKRLLDYLFENKIFRPELVNRFDAFVVFSPLSRKNLLDISELMLQKLKKNLEEKGIEFLITEPLKLKIVELGYNSVFGAREMRRVIQNKLENVLASALLSGKLKRGNKVEVDSRFKLIIN